MCFRPQKHTFLFPDFGKSTLSRYIRAFIPGGTFFFTLVADHRRPFLTDPLSRTALRRAFTQTRDKYPFRQDDIVLLPDHMHCLWTLPPDNADFSLRGEVR